MDSGDGFPDPPFDPIDPIDPISPADRRKPQGLFKPKLKGKVKVKAEPAAVSDVKTSPPAPPPPSDLTPVAAKQEDEHQVSSDVNMSEEVFPGPSSTSGSSSGGVNVKEEEMEVDGEEEEEDEVIREIDVLFNPAPLDEDTALYLMQYPYRPSWRPYEFNENCIEVRVKPKESKIEVDFSMDVDSQNYDKNATVMIEKQTLSSSKIPFVTNYAVGVLSANKLHLNPIYAAVQLRTLLGHVNSGLQKKKHNTQNVEANASSYDNGLHESTKDRPESLTGPNENMEDSEPWISLECHGTDSHFTERYHNKMVAGDNDPIQFTMKTSHYLNSLCPGTSMDKKRTRSELRRNLQKLPLEERLKKWLCEGSQVNRFDALLHLAPEVSDKELLEVLQRYANLVQGLWVSKSSLLQYEHRMVLIRDFILSLFSKNPVISTTKINELGIELKCLRIIMGPLAEERRDFRDWKFKEATDLSFIKGYPSVVRVQELAWSDRYKKIMENLKSKIKVPRTAPHLDSAKKNTPGKSMSKETREHLPKILLKVFQEQRVRSMSSIIRGLRNLTTNLSVSRRDDPKTMILVNAATEGASLAEVELQSVLSQVAVNVHGVYVLKSLDNSALDPLRTVVIDLFRGKKPKEKVNKQEVRMSAKNHLNKDISDPEYNQVMQELCVFNKGAWQFKSGD